jgi:hypothetical protein
MAFSRHLRLAVVVLVGALLSACGKTQVHDLYPNEASWVKGRKTIADGSKLKMVFDHDQQGLLIERVDYKVYKGDLYIWPVRGDAAFQPMEFTLDTADLKLAQPWQDHVYWVGAANWDSPVLGQVFNPSPLGDRVDRIKADVTPTTNPSN